jgi:hypothetical protein
MKKTLLALFSLATLCSQTAKAQAPTRILFIGNSFTAANDLPSIVRDLYTAEGLPIEVRSYAPGGISVGDVAMGTAAHMNNPAVFELIRNMDWTYVVLQDNQGRFALDSARFPSTAASKVIEGHIKIRDSLHYYHPCAKMVWFSGWGFQDEDTSMIDAITTNYRVLNDSAKDVIAPIGPAWKTSILTRPDYTLWSPDGAHPDITGSYLTAAVIYGTTSGRDVSGNPFNYALPPTDANYLKTIAQKTLVDGEIRTKSNLRGIENVSLGWDGTQLKGMPGFKQYRWYREHKLAAITTTPTYTPAISGNYIMWVQDGDNSWMKSCSKDITVTTTSIDDLDPNKHTITVYPNPANDQVSIKDIPANVSSLQLFSLTGQRVLTVSKDAASMTIDLGGLASGMYLVRFLDAYNTQAAPAIQLSKQ